MATRQRGHRRTQSRPALFFWYDAQLPQGSLVAAAFLPTTLFIYLFIHHYYYLLSLGLSLLLFLVSFLCLSLYLSFLGFPLSG